MMKNPDITKEAWLAASKDSWFRWPSIFSFAASLTIGMNLLVDGDNHLHIGGVGFTLSAAFALFMSALLATLPVWYYVTSRKAFSRPVPALLKQFAVCIGVFILAILVAPRFVVEYRVFEPYHETDRRDDTTRWIKRSIVDTFNTPVLKVDELTWLQSNFSAGYIPAKVFCPYRSTRLFPFLGVMWITYDANSLASREPPPAVALANTIARCNRDGEAMRSGGNTKEQALAKGDVDRFFALNALESDPDYPQTNTAIVLEDAEIPPSLLKKMEAVLAMQVPDEPREGEDAASFAARTMSVDPLASDYLVDTDYATQPGQVRRFKALALATALGRIHDIARLKSAKR
jgi:hypothetical protein